MMMYEAVVIGASAGGLNALQRALSPLPADFTMPLLVVLHRAPERDLRMIDLLAAHSRLRIKEAEEKEPVVPGTVYIAPSNYHLLVELDRTLSLSADPKVSFARPAIDPLFETAADAYLSRLIGVILSGANHDGTNGLKRVKKHGGLTIAQDPLTAEAPLMPTSAIQANVVDKVLPLEEIAQYLICLAGDAGCWMLDKEPF